MNTITLLNVDANPKTVKGQSRGYMTAVLYLAPYKLAGYNVCGMAEVAGCIFDCLNTAGRGGIAPADSDTVTLDGGHVVKLNAIQRARIARTRLFIEDRDTFMRQFIKEIRAALRRADKLGLTLAVRPDGTSDIRWEDIRLEGKTIFELFPDIQFYDYTKIPNRRVAHIPNYHLTYSYSARPTYAQYVQRALAFYGAGINLAVVFKGKVPATFMGRDVVNGDESDLRFLDPKGVIVALKAKGRARKSTSGFAVAA